MEKGKQIRSPTLNQEAICKPYLLGKGKSVFSSGFSLTLSITLQGRPHAQGQLTNTKHTSCFLCMFLIHFVFLWYFLSCCFCLKGHKNHDNGLTNSEDEKGFGGEENMIKTHCMKKYFLKKWLGKVLNTLFNSFFKASLPLLTQNRQSVSHLWNSCINYLRLGNFLRREIFFSDLGA